MAKKKVTEEEVENGTKKTKEEKINCLFIGIVNDFYYLCSKILETI